jgi:hypothetical protein
LSALAEESDRHEIAIQYSELRKEREKHGQENEKWVRTEENCRDALRINIHAQLFKGDLVARGFLAPHTPGATERSIPRAEWRFLSLDDADDRALGPNFEYIAVEIGRPHY